MKLTAAKCPNCGANIEVDENSDKTKCEFCNSPIIVEDAIAKYKVELSGEVTVKNLPQVESLMKNAERLYKNNDLQEALDKYDAILDIDADNYNAILKKAICRYLLMKPLKSDISLLKNSFYDVIELLQGNIQEIDNTASILEGVMETNFIKINNFGLNTPVLLSYNEMILKNERLFDIIEFKDVIYNKMTNEALKKFVASNIIEDCNKILMNPQPYSINYKTHFYNNPHTELIINIRDKYNKILNPDLYKEKEEEKKEKNTSNESKPKYTRFSKLYMTLAGRIIIFIIIVLLIIIAFLVYNIITKPYAYKTFYSNDRKVSLYFYDLVYEDKKTYTRTSYKTEKVGDYYYFTANLLQEDGSNKLTTFKWNEHEGLCISEYNECITHFRIKKS